MTAPAVAANPTPGHGPDVGHRVSRDRDAGSGWLGTASGVWIFLAFLLLAAQLLVHLHARTVVTSVARDTAQQVATSATDHADPGERARARERAEQRARRHLGRAGSTARFDWSGTDVDTVVVTITVEGPSLLPPSRSTGLPWGEVSAGSQARVERLR